MRVAIAATLRRITLAIAQRRVTEAELCALLDEHVY